MQEAQQSGVLLCPQFCICSQGYSLAGLHPGTANQTKGCVLELSSFDAHKTLIVATVTAVSGVVVAVAVAVGLAWMLRVQIAAFTLQRAKKRGPPGTLLSLCRSPQPSQGLSHIDMFM